MLSFRFSSISLSVSGSNVIRLLARREICPRSKRFSKRLRGGASESISELSNGPKSEAASDAKRGLISWYEHFLYYFVVVSLFTTRNMLFLTHFSRMKKHALSVWQTCCLIRFILLLLFILFILHSLLFIFLLF